MTTFRFDARQLAIAAVIGASLGVIFYLDAQLVGPEDLQSIAPVVPATGFWILTIGNAVVAMAFWTGICLLQALSRRLRPARDLRHAAHCNARYTRGLRCSCDQDSRNWSPAKRREALRALEGGRRDG